MVAPQINDLWVYLSTSPLLGLTVDPAGLSGGLVDPSSRRLQPARQPGPDRRCGLVALLAITERRTRPISTAPSSCTSCSAGNGGPGRAAVHTVSARARDARSGDRRPAGRQRCAAAVRGPGGAAVRRQPRHAAFAGAEIGDDADRHGDRRTHRRHSLADGSVGHQHRHSRRRPRSLSVRRPAHHDAGDPGLCHRHHRARHRHGACLSGERAGRRLRGAGDGHERPGHRLLLPALLPLLQ
jgi:hypothetical protein